MLLKTWKLITSEIVLLLTGLAIVLGAWGFGEIASEVIEGDTKTFDESIMRALRTGDDLKDAWGPPWLEDAVESVTHLGSVGPFVLLTLAIVVYLLLAKRYLWTCLVLASTIGGTVVTQVLKQAFARPRPDLVPHLTVYHTMSFPSGHAAMSAAIYLTLGVLLAQSTPNRILKVYFVATAMVLTLIIGFSRVYLGVHYPTDVLAGWCIGLAWASLVWLIGYAIMRRFPREKAEVAAHRVTA